MMTTRRFYCSAILLLTLPSGLALAQDAWTPFVAKYRIVSTKITPDGKQVVLHEHRGSHQRTSQGVELLTRAHVVDGVERPSHEATYTDLRKGETYQVLQQRKQAILRARGMKKDGPLTPNAKALAAPQRVVNGIPCTVAPIQSNEPGASGEGCYSYPYDLMVKIEEQYPYKDGMIRTVHEYYDVQLGVNPEPEQVRIPAGFEVIKDVTQMPQTNVDACAANPEACTSQ